MSLSALCSATNLNDLLVVQIRMQHEHDVDNMMSMSDMLEQALKLVEHEQLQKVQIVADKAQLEDKLEWMSAGMKAEEQAYTVIRY